MPVLHLTDVDEHLRARIDPDAAGWVDQRCAEIDRDPAAIARWFPAVGRFVPPAPLDAQAELDDPYAWTTHDAVRVRMLSACGESRAGEAAELYRYGDAGERRGVLRALDVLPFGDAGLPLVQDALRTNDIRLVAAALGPFGAAALDEGAFRQAVLKCVFVGLPLARVSGTDERADAELARMLAAYAHERVVAGRAVPGDIWPIVDRYPPSAELAAIDAELKSAHSDRRAAAEAALVSRVVRKDSA